MSFTSSHSMKHKKYNVFCFLHEYKAEAYTSLQPLVPSIFLGKKLTQADHTSCKRIQEDDTTNSLFKNVHTLEKSNPLVISQKNPFCIFNLLTCPPL